MPVLAVTLAHAGPGASWQALVTTMSLGLVVVFLLAVAGRIPLRDGNDLVLPVAVVAILSAAAPVLSGALSDMIGWAFPAGVVALLGMAVATYSPWDLTVRSELTYGTLVVALVAALALQGPLTAAWHPPEDATDGATAGTTPSPEPT